jgi:type I restriction enzyme M protein
MESRKLRVFTDDDIDKVAETYHAWRNVEGTMKTPTATLYNATIAEVKKQDYKLTPGIYVGTEEVEDDGIFV